jgi:outer membrane biosynthesis protein TonB
MKTRTHLIAMTLGLLALTAPALRAQDQYPVPTTLQSVCLYPPEPNWWAMARRGMRGSVKTQMKIDPKTGEVVEVKLLRKTIFGAFNSEVVMTAFKWRFKPHTITQATVPFELEVRGWARDIR